MRRAAAANLRKDALPVWCDHCRLRIAPYEATENAGGKVFHKHCFPKLKLNASAIGSSKGPGFSPLPA
jgi:hypothetical protein